MNPVEWILFCGAVDVTMRHHAEECQCRTCAAAATIAAWGWFRSDPESLAAEIEKAKAR